MKLPLEILKEKYIPATEFPERYGISLEKLNDLIEKKKVRIAEFRAPGESRRSLHLNYEEVLSAVKEEKNESITCS